MSLLVRVVVVVVVVGGGGGGGGVLGVTAGEVAD